MRRGARTRHDVEVDQSGKVEQTETVTVLAFSNGIQSALLIPSSVKQSLQRLLRDRGIHGGSAALRMFSAGLLVLLEGWTGSIHSLRVDVEYQGKEGEIKSLLMRRTGAGDGLPTDALVFLHVGKRSPAHALAWEVRSGKRPPDRVATVEDLLKYC